MMWKYNFVVISLFLVSSDALYRESKIVFENNGYSNVLLAIHESVTDESIIDKIKVGTCRAWVDFIGSVLFLSVGCRNHF